MVRGVGGRDGAGGTRDVCTPHNLGKGVVRGVGGRDGAGGPRDVCTPHNLRHGGVKEEGSQEQGVELLSKGEEEVWLRLPRRVIPERTGTVNFNVRVGTLSVRDKIKGGIG